MDASALRVYLVEDSAAMAVRIAEVARECRARVVGVASSVKQACAELCEIELDCVVLDFALPDGNALEVLSTLSARSSKPAVIVLSNYPYYAAVCKKAGANWFFDKSEEFRGFSEILGLLSASDTRQEHLHGHAR